MSREKQLAAASKGGKAVHEKGTAYEWDAEAAGRAGKKGGAANAKRIRDAKLRSA